MLKDPDSGTVREILGAIEALSEGLAIFDADDSLVLCNSQFRELHPRMESLLEPGLPWRIYVAEAASHGFGRGLDALDLHLQSGAETELSVEVPRPGERWMRLRLSPIRNSGFVLTETDVTEAHEVAELRAEADGLLRQVLDACGANLMMTRISDGEILYRNPSSESLFGRHVSARALYDDQSRRPDFLAELLAVGHVEDFEVDLLRADGTSFPARVASRLVDYGGEQVIVTSASDMTQLYAQRDELARRREANFQNEKLTALGELLAGVAHELNNPLSVVVGQSLMLREDAAEGAPDLLRRVEKISASAERCAKIVKTFLAMAKQKPLRLVPVALDEIVEMAVDAASADLAVPEGGLAFDLDPDLPPVLADDTQIAQVIVNLVINADQATRPLGKTAQITIRTCRTQDGAAVLVSDNGPGIPQAIRARIFEPFFTTKKVGAGVGLALCHRIVASHSGQLDVQDAPGGGALFRLTLPLADADAARPEDKGAVMAPALHALVVEDEPEVAEMLADMLGLLGLKTSTVGSGEEAVSRLEQGLAPDVILSDLRMPGIGGTGLLRVLRQRWPRLEARLAFVTGDSMNDRGPALGRPILEKPVAPHDLRALLLKLIDKESRG